MKIYQFTIHERYKHSLKQIREKAWELANNKFILHTYGIPSRVRELRKLRRKAKGGGINYTIAVYGK